MNNEILFIIIVFLAILAGGSLFSKTWRKRLENIVFIVLFLLVLLLETILIMIYIDQADYEKIFNGLGSIGATSITNNKHKNKKSNPPTNPVDEKSNPPTNPIKALTAPGN